jgi:hypothetical protein
VGKDINRRIAAEISWSRTVDRSARTRPAREKFLQRYEREVDSDGVLPPDELYRRAAHAKRAYMLRLAKRAVAARKVNCAMESTVFAKSLISVLSSLKVHTRRSRLNRVYVKLHQHLGCLRGRKADRCQVRGDRRRGRTAKS